MATASTATAVSTHSGILPSRVAGVIVDRSGTCSTRVSKWSHGLLQAAAAWWAAWSAPSVA
jgi:hypothetical protein